MNEELQAEIAHFQRDDDDFQAFALYGVDCGGFDTDGSARFVQKEDGRFFLQFYDSPDTGGWVLRKEFEMQLVQRDN